MIIWMVVNHSLTLIKTVYNIPVRILNIPEGKTVGGLRKQGILTNRISLTLSGSKRVISELNTTDFEVVIDAKK